jgi:hypothetical protein
VLAEMVVVDAVVRAIIVHRTLGFMSKKQLAEIFALTIMSVQLVQDVVLVVVAEHADFLVL